MTSTFLDLLFPSKKTPSPAFPTLEEELGEFQEFGQKSSIQLFKHEVPGSEDLPVYINEFWTAKQRDAHSLHEVSYRACFKPQLPRFFIERLTQPGEVVHDPFMGRGTTLLEAALMGRIPHGCDINPLSGMLVAPRLRPPELNEIAARLKSIDLTKEGEWRDDLLVFYHPKTLIQIIAIKEYLLGRQAEGKLDVVDEWIRMVCINRLTGHSPGFFSVYTLPPNQAVAIKSQIKINEKRNQIPPERDVVKIILKKSRILMSDLNQEERATLLSASVRKLLLTEPADKTAQIPDSTVSLVVTSPPFLDVVNYAGDNWLRCWFAGIDPAKVQITMSKKVEQWAAVMTGVFREQTRILKTGGHIAFEVGEVRGGTIRLEDVVVPCGQAAGLIPRLILINAQEFTKTANCWGVDNNSKGTNTNRIILFRKP